MTVTVEDQCIDSAPGVPRQAGWNISGSTGEVPGPYGTVKRRRRYGMTVALEGDSRQRAILRTGLATL
jgi:hypothetical protein